MFRNLLCISKKKADPPKKPEKNYIEYIVQKDFENNECIICLDSMNCEEIEWLKKKKLCPLCDI